MTRRRVWLPTSSLTDRVAVAFGVVLVGLVVLGATTRRGAVRPVRSMPSGW